MNVNVCLSAFPLLCCIWGSNKGPFLVGCMNYGENLRFHVGKWCRRCNIVTSDVHNLESALLAEPCIWGSASAGSLPFPPLCGMKWMDGASSLSLLLFVNLGWMLHFGPQKMPCGLQLRELVALHHESLIMNHPRMDHTLQWISSECSSREGVTVLRIPTEIYRLMGRLHSR